MTDLHIHQGVTWPGMSWPIYDPDDGTTLLDLSEWSARGQIRHAPEDDTVRWTWSTTPAPGEGTITLIGGRVGISLTDTESALFAWTGPLGYDLKATSPDGSLIVDAGAVHITRAYTRE